jgi:hypothetical protein
MLAAYCLPSLFFDPEDGGNTSLRNVGELLLDYMVSHRRSLQPNFNYIKRLGKATPVIGREGP